MALIKTIPTAFGVDAVYWHILAVELNRLQSTAAVTLAGYANEAVRRDGCQPLAVLHVTLEQTDPTDADGWISNGVRYATLYNRIKTATGDAAATLAWAVDG